MAKSVTVRYYVNETTTGAQGYPLRIIAQSAVDMPKEIFVLHRKVPSAMDQEQNSMDDVFVKIAEPNALEEYPVEPPDGDTENCYYRVNEIVLYFRTSEELVETQDLIDACITKLVDSLNLEVSMNEMTEIVYD